jgi:hypothetical protein
MTKLDQLYRVFGRDAILLPVPLRAKKPAISKWEQLTLADTKAKKFQRCLERHAEKANIAIRHGSNLQSIDVDLPELVGPFLKANPLLANTAQTRAGRGRQFHIRAKGEYPNGQAIYNIKHKTKRDSRGQPFIDALLGYLQNAPFSGDTACFPANGTQPGVIEARYRVTWDRADQGSASTVVRVLANDQCVVDEHGCDAERLEIGNYIAPRAAAPALPPEAETRAEEAVRLWTASRRTEMPEGTIARVELLGVSAAV